MSAHTPTPWKISEFGDGLSFISAADRAVTQACRPEDAAFIVKACNAHDNLVRCMDLVATGLEADGRNVDGMTKANAAKMLRAALAKAGAA